MIFLGPCLLVSQIFGIFLRFTKDVLKRRISSYTGNMVCRERSVAGASAALTLRAGKIVRIAPNEFSIDDPDAVKIIYGRSIEFPKADWCAFY